MGWGGSTGETRDRKIEAAPEEMHRAALAEETAAKVREQIMRIEQHTPEALRHLRIIGSVDFVAFKGNWIGDLHRHGPDLHINAELFQPCHGFRVKGSDAHRLEREGFH